ncbi:MmgE/PrpD family protein [Micrococcus lylae]|uniref:2-methylcitrate dehydratase n=1 Tax=Micrococcus lylae TaxID=1273 RepID=A0ABY2JYM4_9MICC|nr:MmgE/PrpD family protein [Micrococcus lylae]TFH98707.1 2-methylcitrate dehydratase [Micrococcus lylae]
MTEVDVGRDNQDELRQAVDVLGSFVAGLRWEGLPREVRERLPVMLIDLLGVTVAGHNTPELQAMTQAWAPGPGRAPLIGSSISTDPDTAAVLNGVAACCMELDEGNKHAQGHPAAHVVFAALAAVQRSTRPVSGEELLTAVAAGYEVAARFGSSLFRGPAWHTHGHWGAVGAAAAASRLLGADAAEISAAIDTSGSLMLVTPWQHVLQGEFARNLWIGHANRAGLDAARLALSGLVSNSGSLAHSLGSIIGELSPSTLVDGINDEWLLPRGYSKLHASCSYTHAAADVILHLMEEHCVNPKDLQGVEIRIHSLAAPLFGRRVKNRLSAMFSLPFVAANAAVNREISPQSMNPGADAFAAAIAFMDRVSVEVDPALDKYLPRERRVVVKLLLEDGELSGTQPNPIGDSDHFPLDATAVLDKVARLIGPEGAAAVDKFVTNLPGASDMAAILTHATETLIVHADR